jgi:23S rRNA (guanosine2251-2'-O)-methyltransferase
MITVYGRMPVLEAVLDPNAAVHHVLVARSARGDAIDEIVRAAHARNIRVEHTDAARVTRVSRNGRHDQGVVADIASPGLAQLEQWLPSRRGPLGLVLLDGLTNPANVGMIIRSSVAAGLDGIVLPHVGSPDVGPLVVKASAGVALSAPILRTQSAAEGAALLAEHRVELVGLRADAPAAIWDVSWPERVVFVFGNETAGISPTVAARISTWCAIPLRGGVASLNVAAAAAVVAFEAARRSRDGS